MDRESGESTEEDYVIGIGKGETLIRLTEKYIPETSRSLHKYVYA